MDNLTAGPPNPDSGVVITCYTEEQIEIGGLVLTNGIVYVDRHNDKLLEVFGAHAQCVVGTTKFVGIAVSAIDHDRIAVAISGIATVLLETDSLKDAKPMDLLVWTDEKTTRKPRVSQCRVPEVQPMVAVAKSNNDVVGRNVVGCLLNLGRAPLDEARVLLLPGLEHLPPVPVELRLPEENENDSSAVAASSSGATSSTSAYASTVTEILGKLDSMQLHDLQQEFQCIISQIENRCFGD